MTEPAIATSEPGLRPVPPVRRSDSSTPAPADTAPSAGGWLAFAAVAWLVLTLWAFRGSLAGKGGDIALNTAALSLPAQIQASLLAGGAVAMWAVNRFAVRFSALSGRAPRLLAGLLAGLLTGGLASGAVLLSSGMSAAAAGVLAVAVGVAGGLGGVLGTLRPATVVVAGICATLATTIVMFAVNLFQGPLLDAFGRDGTIPGNQAAAGYFATVIALTAGLTAGLGAFWWLRWASRRDAQILRWPAYFVAAAVPGLLLVVADLFTRLGAPRLLALAAADATGDEIVQAGLDWPRLKAGMIVFFIGTITAIIAFGKTLPKPSR